MRAEPIDALCQTLLEHFRFGGRADVFLHLGQIREALLVLRFGDLHGLFMLAAIFTKSGQVGAVGRPRPQVRREAPDLAFQLLPAVIGRFEHPVPAHRAAAGLLRLFFRAAADTPKFGHRQSTPSAFFAASSGVE